MLVKNYFKGWYFKCCNKDVTIGFIVAYHRNENKETASLQIITEDKVFNIPFFALKYRESPLDVKSSGCRFSKNGIRLNIKNEEVNVWGKLKFSGITPIKYDIMGPFKYLPFMQCRHSICSMIHRVDGRITVDGREYIFENGVGYIEGDCGYSFPRRYIWTQCCFENGSIMLSVADIPMVGFHFDGIIGIVYLAGTEYRIASYLGAKVKYIGNNLITVTQGKFHLTAKLIEENYQPLFAPHKGKMSKTIHESVACKAYYRFSYKGKLLCEFMSDRASFEFEY